MALSSLAHLTANDQRAFLSNGVGPSRAVDLPIVHHAFERHAQRQPHVVAVEHAMYGHTLSYEQLDKQANRLARRLRGQGIRPGHRVCILARRSIYFIVAVLAVLKSGAQYVPMDAVTITDCTLEHILRDSTPSAVLVMNEDSHRVSGITCLCLEDVIADDERVDADATKPEDLSSPTDGIYVIYTSGTTGVPKGVDVRHNGVSNGEQPVNTLMCFICSFGPLQLSVAPPETSECGLVCELHNFSISHSTWGLGKSFLRFTMAAHSVSVATRPKNGSPS